MELYDIYQTYRDSRNGKRRSSDQVNFELNKFMRLLKLNTDINSKIYIPASNYCFIHKRDKSREVWASTVELKIIQIILDKYIGPLIERELTNKTFNNRKGYGTHAAINNVINDIATASRGYSSDAWIIKLDLKGYFPNVNQDIAWNKISKLICDNYHGELRDNLLYLARIVNYCNPQFNAERRSPLSQWNDEIAKYKSLFKKPFGKGAAIGFLYWQKMSNYYLNDIDKWILSEVTPYYTRFVDDLVMITTNKDYLLSMLAELRIKLSEIDTSLHPKKFYCQHYTKGVEFLGYHIKPHSIHLNRKIVNRAMRAESTNTEKFICKINSYLGMIKCSSDYHLGKILLDNIDREDIIKDYDNLKITRYGIQQRKDNGSYKH